MKRLNIIFAILVSAVVAFSCSDLRLGDAFLEKAPGVDVTIDTVFSSKLYAERALTSAYATMRVGFTIMDPAWPGGAAGHFNQEYNEQRGVNQLWNDNLDAITDLMSSHNDWGSGGQYYYSGQYSAEAENGQSRWTKCGFTPNSSNTWIGIRKAFLYIENVDKVPDMTDEEKAVTKGEAYVIIASHYIDLFRNFGGVPLIKSSVAADNVMSYDFSRKTVEQTLDYILELLDKAAEVLPWTVSEDKDGHFTKASALGLKCRVLLFAASPLLNSNEPYSSDTPVAKKDNASKVNAEDIPKMYWLGGYDPSRWQKVADACEEFIAANKAAGDPYSLMQASGYKTVEDYRNAWNESYAKRYNGEILIETGRSYPTFESAAMVWYFGVSHQINPYNEGRGFGGGCVTLNFVDKFPRMNGNPAKYADWVGSSPKVSKISADVFRNRDPRLYESVMIIGDHFRGRPAEMWVGGKERGAENLNRAITGFSSRKYIWDYNEETLLNRPLNYSYLRLPEIYLTYAEALNELGRTSEAYEYLNKTRRRVGLPDMDDKLLLIVQNGKDFHSYAEPLKGNPRLREEILDERVRELYFEENRWYDLVRWKRDDVFKEDLYAIQIDIEKAVRTTDTNNDGKVNDEDDLDADASTFKYSLPRKELERYWAGHWDPKWYFSAFPTDEINKGYGLVQNPGW